MGKKYIITESQERIITRLVERELGPEESVLVANKNPFKYEEFKDARRVYSPELKDGDRFYKFDVGRFEKYKDDKLNEKLEGKTIRIDDKIVDIRVAEKDYSRGGNLIKLGIGNYYLLIDYKGNYKLEPIIHYGFISGEEEPELGVMVFEEKIKTFIKFAQDSVKEIFKEIPIEERDDKYFQIKQIQRKITDF